MSDAYDRELQQLAMDVGQELGYSDFLKEGVYCVLGGPSFETIAECRMLHRLGADAVGEHLRANVAKSDTAAHGEGDGGSRGPATESANNRSSLEVTKSGLSPLQA